MHTYGERESGKRMHEVLKVSTLRCPCGTRLEAGYDQAMHDVLREHIRCEHPHVEAPTAEQVEEVVSSASYAVHYVPVDDQDGLEAEGFGPEPY
jgi:hypothetical protein